MIKVLMSNADNARSLVKKVASAIGSDKSSDGCDCKKSLNNAIITQPEARDKKLVKKLEAVAGRVLNSIQ
jgi:5'-methylthioadenosine phosphorylase